MRYTGLFGAALGVLVVSTPVFAAGQPVPYLTAAKMVKQAYGQSRLWLTEVNQTGLGMYFMPGIYGGPEQNGIPVVDYAKNDFCGIPRVVVSTPTVVANHAIGAWNTYYVYQQDLTNHRYTAQDEAQFITKRNQNRVEFLRLAGWLMQNQVVGAWHWPVSAPCYGIKHAGWISGLTQGIGVSVLLRAYELTGNRTYLNVASQAVTYLERPETQDGTLAPMGQGLWPQEYVVPGAKPANVLNGGMTGLFGLWEYAHFTGNPQALATFNLLAQNLANNLDQYDFPGWARYDLATNTPAPVGYMSIQIRELKIMSVLTGNQVFESQGQTWLDEVDNPMMYALVFLKAVLSGKAVIPR